MKLTYKTKRLILRPLELDDYETWKSFHLMKQKQKNMWDEDKKADFDLTKSAFKKSIKIQNENIKNDLTYKISVFCKKNGALLGDVLAMDVVRKITQTAFLGYRIDNRYWGQGFGREAVEAMTNICFKELKLHRLEAGIEENNKRSIRLVKSLGYRREGKKKNVVFLRNAWQDLVVYSITCEELGIKWRGFE